MQEKQDGKRPEKSMETAGSLVPDLEGAPRSRLHPHRYAGMEKTSLFHMKMQENQRKPEKKHTPDG